jgi:hypothetical protein
MFLRNVREPPGAIHSVFRNLRFGRPVQLCNSVYTTPRLMLNMSGSSANFTDHRVGVHWYLPRYIPPPVSLASHRNLVPGK